MSVALVWTQFAAYHMDRCEAVGRRLQGRARVLAVEVATTSSVYAWEPSGEIAGTNKLTLFPGAAYEQIPPLRRFRRQFAALRRCDVVFTGVSPAEPDMIALSWLLRLWGVRVIALNESKFDDMQRSARFELMKSMVLAAYRGAIVGATRHVAYYRFLGFKRRRVLPGADGVGVDRIRAEAASAAPGPFTQRPFLYVGRFVAKKNLLTLVDGYARYVTQAGPGARTLVLAGSGELEPALRARVAELGLGDRVSFPGFLRAEEVSRKLAEAVALLLVSSEEQWGLVVNEALAAGIPVIVSDQVGSRDALVRNLVNGFTVPPHSVEAIAAAMLAMTRDEAQWQAMAQASRDKAWLGDAERFADAVELMIDPSAEPAASRIQLFAEEMGVLLQ